MDVDLRRILENIQKSAELVLEHYQARGFRNTLIEDAMRKMEYWKGLPRGDDSRIGRMRQARRRSEGSTNGW